MNERFNAIVGARISEFRKKMAQVNKIAKTTASDIVKELKLDDKQFKRKLWVAKKSLAALPNNVWVDLKLRTNKFQQKIGAIATVMRSFQTITQNTMQGGLITVSPAIVPILASLIGLIGTLGPMIGVLGGSTFALATAFGFAGTAAVAFGAVAIPTITKLFGETEKLNKTQQKAMNAFNGFKETWSGITKDLEKPVLQAFTKAMTAANTIIKMARPLFDSAAVAVNNLLASLNKSLDSAPIKAFFDYMNKQGGPMLETIGKAAGNFIQGFLSMMTAFGPLAEQTAAGFLKMSNGFAEWAAGLSKSEKFQAFVNYINENMPKIRAIFRDALAGIMYFFAAFGPLSSDMMTNLQGLMGRFKAWASSLASNDSFQTFLGYIRDNAPKVITLIGNLWDFLVNLGVALAPMGSKILDIANSFLAWTNNMMQTHPLIGKIIAVVVVLAGAFLALVPNIVAFMTFFSGMGGAIAGIIPKLSLLGGAMMKIGPKIIPMLGTIISVIGNVGAAFLRNAARIAASWIIAMGPIGWVIIAVVALVALIIANWDKVKAWTIAAWTATVTYLTTCWELIVMYATQKFALLSAYFSAIWSAIKTIFLSAVSAVVGYIQTNFPLLFTIIQTYMNLARTYITTAWNFIKTTFSNVLSFLKALVKGDFQGMKNAIQNQMNAAKTAITTIWNAIKSFFSTVLSAIVTTIKTKFEEFKNAVQEKMNAAKQKIIDIWNQAKSFLEGIDLYSIGVNIIQGLVNGIGSMAGAIKEKIAGIGSSIKDGITGALQIHSPSRFMIWVGEMLGAGLVNGIGSMIQPVASMAKKMAIASMVQPERAEFGYGSTGFGEIRKTISVSNDKNVKKATDDTELGNTTIQLILDSAVLGEAVVPHVDEKQNRQFKTRMIVTGG